MAKAGGESSRSRGSSRQRAVGRVGNFEVLDPIGEGGMGRVFKARHVLLDKLVAIKVLKPGLKQKGDALDRFRKEAQALARIDHPNVVPVIDVGTTSKGSAYIAMDYVPGMDLKRWIKRQGAIKADALVFIAKQLISGIAAAHAAGILHRDIKPDNVLVDEQATVKITDFGLAGDVRLSQRAMTEQKFATIAYAAPEVLQGKGANARSDVFSIGATLWHCATGRLPFAGRSIPAVLAAQEAGAPSLRKFAPGLPRSLDNAISQALRYDPDKRPEDAGALLELAFPAPHAGRASAASATAVLTGSIALLIAGGLTFSRPWDDRQERDASDPISADESSSGESEAQRRARIAEKERELEAMRAEREAAMRERARESRESNARETWSALTTTLDGLDADQDAPERISMLSAFLTRYPTTEIADAVRKRLAGEQEELRDRRAEALASVESALVEQSPNAAAKQIESLPAELTHGEDSDAEQFRLALADVRREISEADQALARKALAESVKRRARGEVFEARELLESARQRSAQPDAGLVQTLSELSIAIERGNQQAIERAALARQETLSLRATQAAAFAEKLRDLESELRSGLVGSERATALDRVERACPAVLQPVWQHWLERYEQLRYAEAWLHDALKLHHLRTIALTPIDLAEQSDGRTQQVEVFGVEQHEFRYGVDGRSESISLMRVHPETYRWLANNLPPTEAEGKAPPWEDVLSLCALQRLSGAARWVSVKAGHNDPGESATLAALAPKAFTLLAAVQELAAMQAQPEYGWQELSSKQPAVEESHGMAFRAYASAREGRRGYAEAVAEQPDALVSPSQLANDAMQGAHLPKHFARLLALLPEDPEVLSASVALCERMGLQELNGVPLHTLIARGRAANPFDESLWQAEQRLDATQE